VRSAGIIRLVTTLAVWIDVQRLSLACYPGDFGLMAHRGLLGPITTTSLRMSAGATENPVLAYQAIGHGPKRPIGSSEGRLATRHAAVLHRAALKSGICEMSIRGDAD
jgi:hypothetical protein